LSSSSGEPVSRAHVWAERLRNQTLRRQLARFVVVGVANTLISVAVYRLLLALGAWYVVAAPIAYVASLVNGYVFNRRWTFGARDSTRARVLYVAVQAGGAGLTSLLVLLFVNAAGTGKVGAFLAALVPVTLCTFAANRLWTFADRTA
jgi:putative flippase GtrA